MKTSLSNVEPATLRALRPYVTPQVYELQRAECLIGRQPPCHVLVDTRVTSRKHASIIYEQGAYVLRDCDSTQGTFVNRRRIAPNQPYTLNDGDALGFGESMPLIRFRDPSLTAWRPKVEFDQKVQRFVYGHVTLDLTQVQQAILQHLHQAYGTPCSDDGCIETVWNLDFPALIQAEKNIVKQGQIRVKRGDYVEQLSKRVFEINEELRSIDPEFKVITRRRGVGYMLHDARPVDTEG